MWKPFFLVFLLFEIGCSWDKKVAQVGDYPIYQSAVECRDAVVAINFPDDKRKLGLEQLIQSYRVVQVLKNYGQEVTEAIVKQEKEHIDKTSITPDKLAQIKEACKGADSKGYVNGFVIPHYAERTIYHDFFLHSSQIHQDPLVKATKFKEAIQYSPQQFASTALKEKIPLAEFKVSLARGIEPNKVKKIEGYYSKEMMNPPLLPGDSSQEGNKWIEQIISPLSPGEVYPQLVDQGDVFVVVKYLRSIAPRDKLYEVQAAVFPKLSYNEWIEPEKQKVKLTILHKN